MIRINGVTKYYDKVKALNNLSLNIDKGEFVGLIGPNGAGKTTLLKAIMGLVRPDNGEIAVNGTDIYQDPVAAKRHIGYSPEPPVLYDYLKGFEYLDFVGRIRSMDKNTLSSRITSLLDEFEMADRSEELIVDYSHGMKKKISIAAAFLPEPDILLLDEPTGGLDPEIIYRLKNILKQKHEKGATIVFSSHILETVEKLCSRIVMIHKGNIIADDTLQNLYKRTGKTESLEDIFMEMIRSGN
ncbi:ABC transporter ATP-binding protein [candidate division KSB1 bacterium]|nr:ABC transporter ATP-binding protein [candidate division KSB1 bacterium]